MKTLFALLVVVHGLIHVMGFAHALGFATMAQLTQPISKSAGLLWLAAAVAMLSTAALYVIGNRWWWLAGVIAVVLSQLVIVMSWSDAKFGTIANVIVLIGVVLGYASQSPSSLRATYQREVDAHLASQSAFGTVLLTDGDLQSLPPAVQRYIRLSGAVGQPIVQNLRAQFRGRIRSGPDAPWMPFEGEQHNFFDTPARLFYMDAKRSGIPVQVFHRYVGAAATMRVTLASLWPMVNAAGREMNIAETVTMLNDMCWIAAGALISDQITWEEVDATRVRATFTNTNHTVRATLHFNADGELVDFVSDDRAVASSDGKSFTPMRWSTPLRDYRAFGAYRMSARGEGRWHPAEGSYAYIELELTGIEYNRLTRQ